ncbi:MAG TPA: hypothetical protein DDW90_00410 [Cyanobacteria bacterium UBA9971]|nr:hypothetical protein [Cyanobacteria bacterium UBA9971]
MNLVNPIKKNQKIKIIPDNIEEFSMGIIIFACKDYFVAEVKNSSLIMIDSEPEILISAEDYMIMFASKVNKIDNNKVFFAVPPKFTIVQKREYPRIKTKIPVFIKETVNSKEIEAETINIGGGGMQFVSSVKYNLNCILNARFSLPNKKEINTLFEILRADCEQLNEKILLSGKFQTISNFDKIAIVQFCFKRQLECIARQPRCTTNG